MSLPRQLGRHVCNMAPWLRGRFWDCCGDEDESSPGCETSFHTTFDDDLNEAHGWS